MSVGLFGAYTGSPRLQRAYASNNCTQVGNEETFQDALDDSTVTCIEIMNSFDLSQQMDPINEAEWVGSARDDSGLSIFGSGDDTIDGGQNFGIQLTLNDQSRTLTKPVKLSISDLTLTNFSGNNGTAVYAFLDNESQPMTVDLQRVHFSQSHSNYIGGAVYAVSTTSGATVDVLDSSFDGNVAEENGGAIYVSAPGAQINVRSSTFTDNEAIGAANYTGYGGAIFATGASPSVTIGEGTTFQSNTAGAYGGAISLTSGDVTIDNAGFYENVSAFGGGAIYVPGDVTISHTTVRGNRTGSFHGGGIKSDSLNASYSSITDNTTDGDGGGVFVRGTYATMTNTFIGGNSAEGRGGGIYMWGNGNPVGDITLNYSTLYDDTAASGAFEIHGANVISTMSAVGSSLAGDIWELTGTVDDTNSISTADDTNFDDSLAWGPGVFDLGNFEGDAPGTWGRTPMASSVLAQPVGAGGFAPLANPLVPSVPDDQLGVTRVSPFTIGARQFIPPTPPNPPAPAPSVPASAPREVRAETAVESAKVSWLPPASTGSFPVTSYQAVASPGGETCLVAAPALTCTIMGLTPGKPYTVSARALTGAGWSEASSPSSVVVPLGPEVPTILITNSRDRAQKSIARIEGTTTGLVGAEVVPYLRIAGQTDFSPGTSTRTVDAQGNFVWQRKAKKRFTVYFISGEVTSNRLVIRPE